MVQSIQPSPIKNVRQANFYSQQNSSNLVDKKLAHDQSNKVYKLLRDTSIEDIAGIGKTLGIQAVIS